MRATAEAEDPVDPAPEPIDLASVDWTTVAWTSWCVDGEGSEQVRLEPADTDEPGALQHWPAPDDPSGRVWTVSAGAAVYGDLTGDGHDDAAIPTTCGVDAGDPGSIEVWTHARDGTPEQLLPSVPLSSYEGWIERLEIYDGHLHVHTAEVAPDGVETVVVTQWTRRSGGWQSQCETGPVTVWLVAAGARWTLRATRDGGYMTFERVGPPVHEGALKPAGWQVLWCKAFDSALHRPGSHGARNQCSWLCTNTPVYSVRVREIGGTESTFALCEPHRQRVETVYG